MNILTRTTPNILARNGAQNITIEVSLEGMGWEKYDPAKHDDFIRGIYGGTFWVDIRIRAFSVSGDDIYKSRIREELQQVIFIPDLKGIGCLYIHI